MMGFLDKILNLISSETDSERLARYELLRIDLEKAEEVIDRLAEDFNMEKSMYEDRLKSDSNGMLRDKIEQKFNVFKSYHEGRVLKAWSIVDKIKRKIDEMESNKRDEVISKAIMERKRTAFGVIKKAYKLGTLSSEGFEEAIKKITKDKLTKYADFLLFNEDGDLLLLKRSDWEDSNAGAWVLPGGHVDPGEEFHEAAIRELVEEAGFSVEEFENCGSYKDDKVHIEYFMGHVDSKDHVPVLQWEEIRDSRWVPIDEIHDYTMVFNMKENILKILNIEERPKVNIRKTDRENIAKAMAAFDAVLQTGDEELIEKAYKDLSKYIKTKRLVTRDGKTFLMTVYIKKDTGEVVTEIESKELGSFTDIADVNLGSRIQIERIKGSKKTVEEFTLQNVHMSPGREPVISVLNDTGDVKFISMKTIASLKTVVSAHTAKPTGPSTPTPPIKEPEKVLVSEMTLVKDLGGSSNVKLMSHPNGNMYAVKRPHKGDAEQVKQEVLLDKLYRKFGFEAPESNYDSVAKAKISKYVTGAKELNAVTLDDKLKKEIQKGFVLDCLLGNWDVLGSNKDNILIKDGKPIRIDNGGSLDYRARGGKKDFPRTSVQEIKTMREYEPGKTVFGDISDENIKNQILAIGANRDRFDTLKEGDYPALNSYKLIEAIEDRLDALAKEFGVDIPSRESVRGPVGPKGPVKPKEPEKPKLRPEMPSMVTQEYFDSEEWKNLKVGGNAGIKEHIKRHIIDIEKSNRGNYENIAKSKGISVEQVKANMLKWTKAIVGRSTPYIVAHSGESRSGDAEGSVIQKILKGGRFKSQFETGDSCGFHYPSGRAYAENGYFGFNTDIKTNKENRPIYGFFTDRDHGVINRDGTIPPPRSVRQYGDVCFEVKSSKKNDITVTFHDSLGVENNIAATPFNMPHFTSLNASTGAYENLEYMYNNKVSSGIGGSSYVECQYHNKLSLSDIERAHVTAGQYDRDTKRLSKVINEVIHAAAASGNKIDVEIF